jgi:hypothetical protein
MECRLPGATEKFTISITERGVAIKSAAGGGVDLTAGEALMVLEILEHEADRLRTMAADAAPLPIRFTFDR